jgi:hypothetical protein
MSKDLKKQTMSKDLKKQTISKDIKKTTKNAILYRTCGRWRTLATLALPNRVRHRPQFFAIVF